jgi:hypothetical protein
MNNTVEPMTLEERKEWLYDWYKTCGLDSLIDLCAKKEEYLSNRCKEYRKIIGTKNE